MHTDEIKAFARIVALSSMMEGKIVHIKRADGLYIGRLGGWTDTKTLAARYNYDEDRVADQLMQVQLEHGEEWDAELVEQDERETLLAIIRTKDLNGFLTLQGDETIEQLRETVELLKSNE